jgi:hypothetical protein
MEKIKNDKWKYNFKIEWKLFNKLKQKIFDIIQLLRIFKTDKSQYEKQKLTKQDIWVNQENNFLNQMKKFNHKNINEIISIKNKIKKVKIKK